MTDEVVHYDLAGEVATITLDSPGNRNALSRQLVGELAERLREAAADEDAKVVLLRSSGRVFCSGADLSEAADGGMEEGARAIVALQRYLLAMDEPVVTRLDGPVRAGGIGLVAASDIVVASEEADFALTEVKLGLAVAIISLTVHHRMDSRSAALRTLGGMKFSAARAAEEGLVTTAVPAAEVDGAVDEVLAELVTGSRQGLREAKWLLNRDLVARIDERGVEMADLSARLFASEEAKQAMNAFLSRGR